MASYMTSCRGLFLRPIQRDFPIRLLFQLPVGVPQRLSDTHSNKHPRNMCSIHTYSYPRGASSRINFSSGNGFSTVASTSSSGSSSSGPSSSDYSLKPKVVFMLGGPGAGKGTQCEKLSAEFEILHLSAGELLREERNSGSTNGQLIESLITEGKIVPAEITVGLIKKAMIQSKAKRFLVDGFPRNWDNLKSWQSSMSSFCEVDSVFFIDCPEEELERRLLIRGQTSGRSDDNLASAKKRFITFTESTLPIVRYFEETEEKLVRVRGDQPVDTVYQTMREKFIPLIESEILERTRTLLAAITENDFERFSQLCDQNLSAFSEDTQGELVEGLDFHKSVFEDRKASKQGHQFQSVIENPKIIVEGKSAVITYLRRLQSKEDSSKFGESFDETRVWHLTGGDWLQVHSHSSIVKLLQK